VAAIMLGLRARSVLAGEAGSVMATAAIVIGALVIAQMAIWTVVSAVSKRWHPGNQGSRGAL